MSSLASELRLLFTLAPGDGEEGFEVPAAPLSVGICELLLGGTPSEDLMSRVAAELILLELEPGFDLSFLKKKLMLSCRVVSFQVVQVVLVGVMAGVSAQVVMLR